MKLRQPSKSLLSSRKRTWKSPFFQFTFLTWLLMQAASTHKEPAAKNKASLTGSGGTAALRSTTPSPRLRRAAQSLTVKTPVWHNVHLCCLSVYISPEKKRGCLVKKVKSQGTTYTLESSKSS